MPGSWTTFDAAVQLALPAEGARHAALEHALRTAIRAGRLPAGTRIPSSRALASDLGLARGTVVEAYAQLQAEGYLSARRGAGSWVAEAGAAAVPQLVEPAPSPPAPRFSFHPGLPDLTLFPRAAWSNALRRGLRAASAASLGYDDPRGRLELREALAAYLTRARGVIADPELIVVCGGFGHALSLLARVLHAGGVQRIAMEDPCLDHLRTVVDATGLQVVPLPVDGHGARTDVLGTTRAGAALLTPAHQFPVGAVLHQERRAAAVCWARSTGALLIEDDYDAELRFDRQAVGALQALAPERVAYGGTASKTLAPGLRLAWLVVPREYVRPLAELRRAEDMHSPACDQIAFAEMLRSGAFERHVRSMRARYRGRRDRLVQMLAARAPYVTPVGISAGLRALLLLPPGAPSGEELVVEAARRSIALFPLRPLHHDGRPAQDGIVVGYGAVPEHSFAAALEALGDLLADTVTGTKPQLRSRAKASRSPRAA